MTPDKKELRQRIIILALLFLVQIFWFIAVFTSVVDNSAMIQGILYIASVFLTLFLVVEDESPTYRMSWIILVAFFPLFGVLFYFMIGKNKPAKWMKEKIEEQTDLHQFEMDEVPKTIHLLQEKDPRRAAIAEYIQRYSGMPVHINNDIRYYPSGESMMGDLLRDLKAAKKTIFIEFFIVEPGIMFDTIFDVLFEKVKEGVDVRFLYDDFGSITRLPDSFDRMLEQRGIKALKFNPMKPIISFVYNTRDHRKFIIIDSKISYTGGLNLADEYINLKRRFGYWKDTMIRIDGPATWNLTNLFLNMWNSFYPIDQSYEKYRNEVDMEMARALLELPDNATALGFVQPFGDTPLDSEPIGENVYREILASAEEYVYIYTPYLVISYELQTAIQLAAKRGVEVILMTPGIPDKPLVFRMTRSYYRPLLKAGVKIYEYTPGFLHAKTFISDDVIANVGTINLDYRSLYLHFETSTMLYYHPEIAKIKQDFQKSMAVSKRIGKRDVRVGLLGALWDAILRLMAPLV